MTIDYPRYIPLEIACRSLGCPSFPSLEPSWRSHNASCHGGKHSQKFSCGRHGLPSGEHAKNYGKSPFLMGKSPFLMGESQFLMGKSQFFMGKSHFFMEKSPFFMGKSTISMAIFHCYVSSPEDSLMIGYPQNPMACSYYVSIITMLEVTKGNPILTYNMVNPINHPPNHHFYTWKKAKKSYI